MKKMQSSNHASTNTKDPSLDKTDRYSQYHNVLKYPNNANPGRINVSVVNYYKIQKKRGKKYSDILRRVCTIARKVKF